MTVAKAVTSHSKQHDRVSSLHEKIKFMLLDSYTCTPTHCLSVMNKIQCHTMSCISVFETYATAICHEIKSCKSTSSQIYIILMIHVYVLIS